MTETRSILDQMLDGIIAAGAWMLALTLPALLFAEQGCVNAGYPVMGLILAVVLYAYIRVNARNACAGERTEVGDLLARVVTPLLIFVSSAVLLT